MMSLFFMALLIEFLSRTSPFIKVKLLLPIIGSKLEPPYNNESKTVTLWFLFNKYGTSTEPIYPAPPVIRILINFLENLRISPFVEFSNNREEKTVSYRLINKSQIHKK